MQTHWCPQMEDELRHRHHYAPMNCIVIVNLYVCGANTYIPVFNQHTDYVCVIFECAKLCGGC